MMAGPLIITPSSTTVSFADENFFADERPAFAPVVERGFQIGGEVTFDFFERLPGDTGSRRKWRRVRSG